MTLDELKELMETGEEFEMNPLFGTWKFIDGKLNQKKVTGIYLPYYDLGINYILEKVTIIRKPWKPKEGESYWYWYPYGGKIEDIAPYKVDSFWSKSMHDLPNLIIGNCFRTKEECEAHPEVRDKLIEMRKEYV